MQLSLKRKGDYAVRAMISVGRHYGTGLRQARQISTEMHIPYKTLTLILAGLVAEGLLVATHGPKGGYRLARNPADISVLEIVEAAEGPVSLDHCVLRDGPCDWKDTCPVHDTWARTQDALTQELASTSLAEIAAIDAAIEAGSYQPEAPPHTRPTARHGNRNYR
jgi:Rrf2 family protein